jgi:hypothetical protein
MSAEPVKNSPVIIATPALLLAPLIGRATGTSQADYSTDMKATAGARKVNMADENSPHVRFAAPSYFIARTL